MTNKEAAKIIWKLTSIIPDYNLTDKVEEAIHIAAEALEERPTAECAKLDIERFPTAKPDEWYIAVKTKTNVEGRENGRYRSFIRSNDKDWVVSQIGGFIHDLTELQKMLTEDEE